MELINPGTTISRAKGFVTAPVNNELMMLNVEQGAYYSLDPIAANIWELIESPAKVQDIVSILRTRYKVSLEECQAEVLTFLGKLNENGMIELDNNPN
jgi:hypothetical protein